MVECARKERIVCSSRNAQRIVQRWETKRTLKGKPKTNLHKILVSDRGLIEINKALIYNSELTANAICKELFLLASPRSVLRYIKLLGWKNSPTQYCQIVSKKNEIERFYFSCTALTFNDDFENVFYRRGVH